MPIYEYRCATCGHEVEIIQKIGARAPGCGECDGRLEKLISRASFQLKGGGWYDQGYSKSGSKKPATKSSSSSESKPKSGSKKTSD